MNAGRNLHAYGVQATMSRGTLKLDIKTPVTTLLLTELGVGVSAFHAVLWSQSGFRLLPGGIDRGSQ